ncbi:MAG: aldehyde dehydrogenase [Vulcanibacillus sp.]
MEGISNLIKKQREYFNSGKTLDRLFRVNSLRRLKEAIKENEQLIIEALKIDLNKSEFESYLSEIGFIYEEINHAISNIHRWTSSKSVRTPITHIGSTSRIYYEPYGLTLIISPWNYPFQLAIAPLIASISAGNCAIIKPSELSPNVSEITRKIIEVVFEENYVAVVEGGVEVSTALLNERFDYIFYTGGTNVGRIVMEKAAKNLTPVTLELGGKSPCIIHYDSDIKLAAKRIVWGKFLNAGQTCIAPDYLYVHKDIKNKLIEYMNYYITEFYGTDSINNEDFPKIINIKHFERLKNLLEEGKILTGGKYDEQKLKIEPTIIDLIDWDAPVMQEEIFGPILPMIEYTEIDSVINMINNHSKPLALYIFSNNRSIQDKVVRSISYGGGCINDTIYHIANLYLPFGGVGNSGIGSYHGKSGFETFSHKKSVLKQTTLFDIPLRYPSTKNALKMVKMFFK